MSRSYERELEEQNQELQEKLDELSPAQDRPLGTYLGDAVYVAHDGFALVLATTDGVTVTNRITLEPEIYTALVRYVEQRQK